MIYSNPYPAPNMKTSINKNLYNRRKLINILGKGFAWASVSFGLFWLIWILITLTTNGLAGFMELPIFTQDTPPPNTVGGLRNAIVGSSLIVSVALAIGIPVGVLTGVYLAEFDKGGYLGRATRFMNDILLSAPSIIIGLFVYTLMVRGGSFSGISGSVALALIIIPVIVRTTENMLRLIPNALREAGYALGAPRYKLVFAVTLRSAKAGVLTGVLLGFARIIGETAPLLFTALNNQYFSTDMSAAMANLPNTIYQLAMYPDETWHKLAWSAAFLIAVVVLGLNLFARTLDKKS